MKKSIVLLAFLGGVCSAAQAGLMAGRSLNFAAAFPSSSNGANTSAVVGDGVEFTAPTSYGGWTVDASDTQLTIFFPSITFFTVPAGTTPFNGLRVSDLGNFVDAFGSVTIDPLTTLSGFDASRVAFTDNEILVNFAGLTSAVGNRIVLNVSSLPASSVPEPSSVALLAGGLVGLIGAMRRSTSRGARTAA